jgi:hypothetical protein
MKHLRSIVLAVALIAAGATACFKDPTSSLRNGPSLIDLTRSSMFLKVGDSLSVQAVVKDAQGNTYDAGDAAWASDVPAVAVVRKDTTVAIPFNAFSAAFIRGVSTTGGVATVSVTSHGITNQLRVVVLPVALTASATVAVSGTARTDTIPGVTPDIFSAGDTITFTTTAAGLLTFSPTASLVGLGTKRAYLVSRTATVIKAIAPVGFRGHPWVTGLTFNGPAAVGPVAIDSLQSDSIVVSKPRFYGTVTQTGDTMFLTAQAGSTFDTVTATRSSVRFGATAALVLKVDPTHINVLSSAAYTGQATVARVKVGAAVIDSLKTPAAYTMNAATFPGAVTSTGNIMDTLRVYSTAAAKFTTTGANLSDVQINGLAAFVLMRTADSMLVIPKRDNAGKLTVTNVNAGGTNIPSLKTPASYVIGPATNEPNEPGNDVRATATTLAFTGAADTITVYGALDCEDDGTACPGNGDIIDYYQIAYAGGAKLRAIVTWFGNGTGGAAYNDTNNPDIDVAIRDAAANYYSTNTAANGSGSKMPEIATTTTLAANTYYVRVMAWLTPSPITYKLQLLRTP